MSFEAVLFSNDIENFSTPSIEEASFPLNHIPAFPDWFVVAYPDVFLWFIHVQKQAVQTRSSNVTAEDATSGLLSDVFELEDDEQLELAQIFDGDRRWLPRRLKTLISKYKQRTGKQPETSVYETRNKEVIEVYERAYGERRARP